MSRMSITYDLNELVEKNSAERRKLRDLADQLVAKATAEDRAFTKEEEAGLTELQDKIVALGKRSDLIQKQAEIRAGLEAPGVPKTRQNFRPGDRPAEGDDEGKEREKRYAGAFVTYIRSGMAGMSDEDRGLLQQRFSQLPSDHPEVRALSAITGVAGGFAVPQGFIATVETAMKDYSGVLKSKATILPTDTGADLPYPTVNDTNNEGEQVEENQATGEGDVVFGQIMLKAYLFSSKLVLLPIQLIQDTGVNVEALISRILGERLGRICNRRFTTGNGANQPQGIVTGATVGKTAAAVAAITYDEMIDLQHSVDPAYRQGAEWMFHDLTFAALRKLKDSDGRPIWMPALSSGMAGGAPGLLLDAPYIINNNMAQMAASARTVLWGQTSKYHIRHVRNLVLVRLTERYAEKMQVGFFAFMRCDGRIVDAGTNPIKVLVQAAA